MAVRGPVLSRIQVFFFSIVSNYAIDWRKRIGIEMNISKTRAFDKAASLRQR